MKRVLVLVLFLCALYSEAQDFKTTIAKPLLEDQLFFEKVFVHTNKTIYWLDDTIWFKAYVVSSENIPSLKTTLLYVNLLDEEGRVLERKNVLINKGVGTGQFELTGNLKSGTYFIQSYTNYMRNFGDDNYYVQKLTIINEPVNTESSQNSKPVYDIQILPEGGYLIENTENVTGIKVLVNNQSIDYTGQILDSNNKEVAAFTNMHLGMTRCKFYYKATESYTAKFVLKDTVIKRELPKSKRTGVALQVYSNNIDSLQVHLQTNTYSIDNNKNTYTVLFHQKNKLIDYAQIILKDTFGLRLKIGKSAFYNGVNTVTVFNEINQPVLERKFFIEKSDKQVNLTLKQEKKWKDSIGYKLRVETSGLREAIASQLSVSVLSVDNNYSLNKQVSIESAFLLSPYLKGTIENPAYYFSKTFKNRLKFLDLLLLNQGWVQYTAKEMIADLNPKYNYDFELGFNLKGRASPLYTNNLALLTDKDEVIDKVYLNNKGAFNFNKLLVYKGDKVKLAFVGEENEAIKPKEIQIDSTNYFHLPFKNYLNSKQVVKSKTLVDKEIWKDFYNKDHTRLDAVKVVGKKRSEAYIKRKRLINKYRKTTFDIGKYMVLDIPEYFLGERKDLMTYLTQLEGVSLKSWKGVEWYLEVGYKKEALLFIDGERVESAELPGVILYMEDVENIMMQPIRGNRIYQVFTTENYKKDIQELFKAYTIFNGYSKSKQYYTPLIENTVLPVKEIDWKPRLKTNKEGTVYFKVKHNKNKVNYVFLIEGVSKDGHLISDMINLN
ncbi:hypothetical protein VOI54_01805 [Tamlana sp. 2201CG12-4]|uniref:hypothetical protein n=1 Tax=Tamlana sp. 2201CG12-4 TaxID=3112582 RepID=UPI002DBF1E75|nr:hypothetical protein [Tamlana sp. 2201CG12-4]MEC3905743.1 hypothetical protein [Tamlana sp. 2201CG12-4]